MSEGYTMVDFYESYYKVFAQTLVDMELNGIAMDGNRLEEVSQSA